MNTDDPHLKCHLMSQVILHLCPHHHVVVLNLRCRRSCHNANENLRMVAELWHDGDKYRRSPEACCETYPVWQRWEDLARVPFQARELPHPGGWGYVGLLLDGDSRCCKLCYNLEWVTIQQSLRKRGSRGNTRWTSTKISLQQSWTMTWRSAWCCGNAHRNCETICWWTLNSLRVITTSWERSSKPIWTRTRHGSWMTSEKQFRWTWTT